MDSPNGKKTPDALALKAELLRISPLIEAFTAEVCPGCRSIYCSGRHGTPGRDDEAFIGALGETPSAAGPRALDTEPCRHLGRRGCTLQRWQRPWRCTWYFCAALLEAMAESDPRGYRTLVERLGRLQALRQRFVECVADAH